MGGGFLYLWIPVACFLLVAGVMTLLISIFYVGEWWEKKQHERRMMPDEPLDAPPGDDVKR